MPATQLALIARGRRPRGRARRGLDQSVAHWRTAGVLEPELEALIALARISADALDGADVDPAESRYTVGALAGRHRDVLVTIYDRITASTGPTIGELLAAMGDDAEP